MAHPRRRAYAHRRKALGIAPCGYEKSIASPRAKAFGVPREPPGIQFMLADMKTELDAAASAHASAPRR